MKMITAIISLVLFSSVASADNEFALLAGLRSSSAETDLAGASITSKASYQFGALVNLDLYSRMALRTGLVIAGRQVTLGPTAQGKVDLDFTYVDIPVTGLFRFSDIGGIFAGPVFAFNQGKDVSCSGSGTCAAKDVKSVIVPLQLGVSFRFASQLGAELYYEYAAGDLAANLSNMKTVGANFLVYFE